MSNEQSQPHANDELRAQPKESFRIQFQQRWREYLARYGTAAEGFRAAWQHTAEHVLLDEGVREELYWELINWSRNYELFTSTEHADAPPRSPGATRNL